MGIEARFDVGFVARLTSEEKQIQQNYRPVIGVHKWFARRPGSLFRSLLLAEFSDAPLRESYFAGHNLTHVTVGDPFMGGGTSLFEANRLGAKVVGCDINPMAYWVVRQELVAIDRESLRGAGDAVVSDVGGDVGELYRTRCLECGAVADAKYFLWVKTQRCGGCAKRFDLFPGYLVADNSRHTHFVLHCPTCGGLAQLVELPPKGQRATCSECRSRFDWARGPATNNRYECPHCQHVGRYPKESAADGPPEHRLFGIEYRCAACAGGHRGRFFKAADREDLARFKRAARRLEAERDRLLIPDDPIPDGDETKRLHRWGYRSFQEMFNARQLLGLALLSRRIGQVEVKEMRFALATVFSDALRYQNMLCRYDTYALKCQDIFAVHGFPVGLVQCENNLLGIPGIGSGGFVHFLEKYDRAKAYCEQPFETVRRGTKKRRVVVSGECIDARQVRSARGLSAGRAAWLWRGSFEDGDLPESVLDGVFTDPPYFDNVQYAELMDFCYAWLRLLLREHVEEFRGRTTRAERELTGNKTTGKGLEHFTEGLSRVFVSAANALRAGAPFVFTYHHNDIEAYVPVVVALLDAGLFCTATLPAPAEMTASLHINGTGSSSVDTVIVARRAVPLKRSTAFGSRHLERALLDDRRGLLEGGVTCTRGDLACLAMGHLARVAVEGLRAKWASGRPTAEKMRTAAEFLGAMYERCQLATTIELVGKAKVFVTREAFLPFEEFLEGGRGDKVLHGGNGEDFAARR